MATAPEWLEPEIAQRRAEVEATLNAQQWTATNADMMAMIRERMVELQEKYPHPAN